MRKFFFDASKGHESFSRGREGRERVVQHEAAPVLTEDDGDRITEFLKWKKRGKKRAAVRVPRKVFY